jgi:hypothetical protein
MLMDEPEGGFITFKSDQHENFNLFYSHNPAIQQHNIRTGWHQYRQQHA